jgi:hypothetical protein
MMHRCLRTGFSDVLALSQTMVRQLIHYSPIASFAEYLVSKVLVDALLLGAKDGQDILSLSLGGADGWTESSSAVVASRIAASGKVITISAGNDVRVTLLALSSFLTDPHPF